MTPVRSPVSKPTQMLPPKAAEKLSIRKDEQSTSFGAGQLALSDSIAYPVMYHLLYSDKHHRYLHDF